MAMTAEGMWTRIKNAIALIEPYQGPNSASTLAYREQVGIAMCQGIIAEIKNNAVVTTTSGAPDGEHTGEID